jgi:hypothetical protein
MNTNLKCYIKGSPEQEFDETVTYSVLQFLLNDESNCADPYQASVVLVSEYGFVLVRPVHEIWILVPVPTLIRVRYDQPEFSFTFDKVARVEMVWLDPENPLSDRAMAFTFKDPYPPVTINFGSDLENNPVYQEANRIMLNLMTAEPHKRPASVLLTDKIESDKIDESLKPLFKESDRSMMRTMYGSAEAHGMFSPFPHLDESLKPLFNMVRDFHTETIGELSDKEDGGNQLDEMSAYKKYVKEQEAEDVKPLCELRHTVVVAKAEEDVAAMVKSLEGPSKKLKGMTDQINLLQLVADHEASAGNELSQIVPKYPDGLVAEPDGGDKASDDLCEFLRRAYERLSKDKELNLNSPEGSISSEHLQEIFDENKTEPDRSMMRTMYGSAEAHEMFSPFPHLDGSIKSYCLDLNELPKELPTPSGRDVVVPQTAECMKVLSDSVQGVDERADKKIDEAYQRLNNDDLRELQEPAIECLSKHKWEPHQDSHYYLRYLRLRSWEEGPKQSSGFSGQSKPQPWPFEILIKILNKCKGKG